MAPQIIRVCQMCEHNNIANFTCVECNGDVCSQCYTIHKNLFPSHLFKKIEEPRGLCLKHFQEIELFDPNLNVPLCPSCESKGEVWDWQTLKENFQHLAQRSGNTIQQLSNKLDEITNHQYRLTDEKKQQEFQIQIKTEEKIQQAKEEEKNNILKIKTNYEEQLYKSQMEENRIRQLQKELQNVNLKISDKLIDITDKYVMLKEILKEEQGENEVIQLPILKDVLKDIQEFQEIDPKQDQEFPPLVPARSEKSESSLKIPKKVHSQASSSEYEIQHAQKTTVWPKFNLEEYMSALLAEDFYMYRFKTAPCPYTNHHNITTCIYGHSSLIRRPPDIFKYQPIKCEHMFNEGGEGCPQGITCQYTHCKLEYLFHPEFYKTTQCKNKDHDNKADKSCAFYHTVKEQRYGEPTQFMDPYFKTHAPKT